MTIRYSLSNLQELSKQFDSKVITKAQFLAINKVLPKVRTHISRRIREKYNVTNRAINSHVKILRASMSRGTLAGLMRYKGERMGVVNFGGKVEKVTLPKKPGRRAWGSVRYGASAQIFKSGSREMVPVKSGFIATGKNDNRHVFFRIKRRRLASGFLLREALQAAYVFSVPEMVKRVDGGVGAYQSYTQFAGQEFAKEFDVAMNYYMGKAEPRPNPEGNL